MEDKDTIRNMVAFFKGIGATRKLLMWTAGAITALVAIVWPAYYLVNYLVKKLVQ